MDVDKSVWKAAQGLHVVFSFSLKSPLLLGLEGLSPAPTPVAPAPAPGGSPLSAPSSGLSLLLLAASYYSGCICFSI